MPHIHQGKYHSHLHKVKRLHRHGNERQMLTNLPGNIATEDLFNRTSQYTKFFDYPLRQLVVDHSTNPLQNTTRQYLDRSLSISHQGRFANHEMIIRRNGETTILRPKHDLVLANGFTPVIRPSSKLPSYQSIITHPQVPSSISIRNKMSMKKCEQTSIIKTKRKNRHVRKRCNEIFNQPEYHSSNHFEYDHPQKSNFLHLFEQALHDMINRQTPLPPQPVPLMSILPQFHSPYNQSTTPRFEEPYFNRSSNPSPYSNDRPMLPLLPPNRHPESFYNPPLLSEQYRSFEGNDQSYFNSPPSSDFRFHSSMSSQRNCTHMSGYFFN